MNRFVLAAAAAIIASPAAAEPTEIHLWHAMRDALGESLQEIVDGYNASQDQFEVVPTYKGFYTDVLNGAIAAYRANEQPHIIQTHEVTALTMIMSGAVVPAQEMMDSREYNVDWSDFIQPLTRWYMTDEGTLLSMPFNTSTPQWYWNKDAYRDAGLDPETPPTTWQEVEEHAKALKAAGHECPIVLRSRHSIWPHIEAYSLTQKIQFATQSNGFDGLDVELTVNDPAIVAHLTRLQDWLKSGLAVFGGEASGNMWVAGDCATQWRSSASQGGYDRDTQFEYGVAPIQYEEGTEPNAPVIGGATLWTMKGHDESDYDGVAGFFAHLTQPEVQVRWHQQTGYVPITNTAYAAARKEGYYDENPNRQWALEQLNRPVGFAGLRLGNYAEVRSIIMDELDEVLSLKKEPKEAMDAAVARAQPVLDRFARQNAN